MEPNKHLALVMVHPKGLKGYFEDLQYEIITLALEHSKTTREAAQMLGINRTTLSMRMLSYLKKGKSVKRFGPEPLDAGKYFESPKSK